MTRKETEMTITERKQMRGGTGTAEILHIVDSHTLNHARLFAKITLPEGASIGKHIHDKETEYYYILQGNGIVEEADGEKKVAAGDVVITGNGASHSIKNTKTTPLVFLAVIILDD